MAAYYKVDVVLNSQAVSVGLPSPQSVSVTLPLVGPQGPQGAAGAAGATGPQGPQGVPGTGLEVLTTQGDLLYQGAATGERLPIGTSGQVLKVSSGGIPAWGAESGAVSSVAGRTGAVTLAVADVAGAVASTDSRLTDARTPTSHTHGNISNSGAVGSVSGLPLKTGTNGVIEAGSFSNTAGSFCAGDDARLSDDRDPNLHAASHLPEGADELFDQSLNSSDSPTFAEVSIAGDETYALKTDVTTYSGNNGFAIANGSSEIFSSTPAGEIIFAGSSAFLGIADRTDTTDRGLDKGVYGDSGCLKFWNNTTQQNTMVIADNGDVYIGPNGYGSLSYDGTDSSWGKNFLVAGNISARDVDNGFDATFDVQSQLSDDVTLTIPDQSGTLAVVDDLPTEVTDLAATGISADYVPVAQGDGTIVWEAQSGGGGGDTVSIQSTAADILSVSSGAISADDAGADRIVYWNNTSNKLTYGTPSDVGAAASSHTHSDATQSVAGFLSTTDKSKLDGIASGAEVNVNADWNASSGDAQILNKPTLGTAAAAAATDFAAASHTHAASAITSGTLDVARLPVGTGSTQVAAGNHTHVVADVTGAAASGSITTSGLTQSTARILGRTTASTGSIEEIQIGSGLSLSAGELSSTVSAGIPATILDAKGDLIVASAADTAARLAVGGTNGHVLTVDSAETLGLKYAALPAELVIACSDETTNLTTGTAKVTFRMPYAMTLSSVRASVNTAPTGSTLIVDINEGGSTVLSTKLSIDASEKTSTTAASAAVISDSAIADDAEITIDIDQIGSTIAGKGLKVVLIGTRA
jgi:hypothetical protein